MKHPPHVYSSPPAAHIHISIHLDHLATQQKLLVTKILLQNKQVGRVLLSMLSESHLGRVNVVC